MVSQPADLNVERPVVAISPSATLRREAEVAPVRDIVPVQQNSFASYTLCHKELYNRDDLAQYLNDLGGCYNIVILMMIFLPLMLVM